MEDLIDAEVEAKAERARNKANAAEWKAYHGSPWYKAKGESESRMYDLGEYVSFAKDLMTLDPQATLTAIKEAGLGEVFADALEQEFVYRTKAWVNARTKFLATEKTVEEPLTDYY